MIAIGTLATLALRRTGYRLPLVVGFFLLAGGTLLLSVAPRWGVGPYAWLAASAAVIGLGVGVVNPTISNASLQLAPREVAAITGLRSTFVNIGIIFSVSVGTAILNRSADPGLTQSHIYWVAAGFLLLVMVPLVYWVPEHKGSW